MKRILLAAALLFGAGNSSKAETKNDKDMKPIEITRADFLKRVADYEKDPETWHYLGDKPAVIDFYATWCGPCRSIAPLLEELAAKYGDQLYIYKIDVDREQELAAAFGIRSIPTLLFVPLEGQPRMVAGAQTKSALEQQIAEILPKK